MSRMPEIIVLLWFVPVVLHVVLPLLILLGYSVIRIFLPQSDQEKVVNAVEMESRVKPQPAMQN